MTDAAPLKKAVERCKQDPRFKRWFDTMCLQNPETAEDYARRAVRLTKVVGLDPISYVALYAEDAEAFDDVTQDIANALVRRGRNRHYVQSQFTGLHHWTRWCRCKPGRKLIIGNPPRDGEAPRQQVPAQAQLRRVLAHLDARSRVMLAFRAFAGIRPGILGNKAGTNGLRLRDLEGLTFRRGRVHVAESVLKVNVSAALSKNKRPFFSFLGQEGIDYLLAYLRKREEYGERLRPESPVVVPLKFAERSESGFVQRDTLTEPVSKAMRAAGLRSNPYVWRSYFKTQLLIAQSQKGLLVEYVEFWMGHANGIKAVYSFHKELNEGAVQEIRAAYEQKALPYLETQERGEDPSKRGEDVKRMMLDIFHVPADEVAGLDLGTAEPGALGELLQRHQDERLRRVMAEAAPASGPVAALAVAGGRQMVVSVDQVQAYVGLGWRYVYEARLPEGLALVEGPRQSGSGEVPASFA